MPCMECLGSRHPTEVLRTTTAMATTHLFAVLLVVLAVTLDLSVTIREGLERIGGSRRADRSKRLVPVNENCNPTTGTCSKGDFVDEDIADCKYDRTLGTCTASGDTGGVISWVVEPDAHDRCKPMSRPIRCGSPGTNTRCVCSDYKVTFNECR